MDNSSMIFGACPMAVAGYHNQLKQGIQYCPKWNDNEATHIQSALLPYMVYITEHPGVQQKKVHIKEKR